MDIAYCWGRLPQSWQGEESGQGGEERSHGSGAAAIETFGGVKWLILKIYFCGTDTWMLHKNAQLFQKDQVPEFANE